MATTMDNNDNNTDNNDNNTDQQQGIITKTKLQHLDDTDLYATVWSDVLEQYYNKSNNANINTYSWGGRGQGGRGYNRRTIQPYDIIVNNVTLDYGGGSKSSNRKQKQLLLLEQSTIKLLSGHVYGLIGYNGIGKTSLLLRMYTHKIPGFPPHISTLYIHNNTSKSSSNNNDITVIEYMKEQYKHYCTNTLHTANKSTINDLEVQLENLDVQSEDPTVIEQIEQLAETIAELEDEMSNNILNDSVILEALTFMGIDESYANQPMDTLSPGQLQKVTLSSALLCCCMSESCNTLLLLDEPTINLDIPGLLRLRHLIDTLSSNNSSLSARRQQHSKTNSNNNTTIVLVSHDIDIMNDVVTDIIEMADSKLTYYAGNYTDYLIQRQQKDRHMNKQITNYEKKQESMKQTLQNIQKQPTPKRGGAKKKSKQITSYKKKMDRELGNTTTNATSLPTLPQQHRNKQRDEPDKNIQFKFRNCSSQWNEALIVATDIGYGNNIVEKSNKDNDVVVKTESDTYTNYIITKKDGYLFDCIDLCIDEGGIYCIVGENGCGKTALLKILAKQIQPIEGIIDYAVNVDIAYIDQDIVNSICSDDNTLTPLQYIKNVLSSTRITEQEIRSELTNFGLLVNVDTIEIRFLSDGEKWRMVLALIMLQTKPHILCIDQPTIHMDVTSVEAFIYGIQHWNGTIIMVSHDTHLLRSLNNDKGVTCYALIANEGKLRRIQNGIDEYIRSFI